MSQNHSINKSESVNKSQSIKEQSFYENAEKLKEDMYEQYGVISKEYIETLINSIILQVKDINNDGDKEN